MYYYKVIDDDGDLVTIVEKTEPFEHPNCVEITKEEYDWMDKVVNWFVPM